jgi:hypothetical protein
VEISGNQGVVIGDHTQVTMYLPRPDVDWPVWSGDVPPLAEHYQPRDEALDEAGSAAVVVSGMGGVGKTQIAAHQAFDARRCGTDLVVWVSATSRDAVLDAYSRAAQRIMVAQGPWEAERAAQALLEWLVTTQRKWLVVLDDVATPAVVRGLWPPENPAGQTVATTRYRGQGLSGRGRRMVEIGVFTPTQSRDYLTAEHLAGSPADLDALADDLGHLPLALSHAAAYMINEDMTTPEYRALLADHHRRVDALFPNELELGDGHDRTIAATWSASTALAETLTPGIAVPLLRISALLDPNAIPTALFTTPPITEWLTTATGQEVTGDTIRQGLRVLHRLNLLTIDSAGGRTGIHGLVQRVTRDATDPTELPAIARLGADALLAIWPRVDTATKIGPLLRANTAALRRNAETHLWQPDGHNVLLRAGQSLGEAGLLIPAIAHFHHLRATATHILGADHPNTLRTRNNLASWWAEAGDVAGAIAEFEVLLTDQRRVLGADHPDTLRTRNNLARWRAEAGDVTGTIAEFQTLLADQRRALGADHPETLFTRNNLAYFRADAGDVAGAIAELEILLADLQRVLGADHPHTLRVRNNLARWRAEAGDVTGAIAEFQTLLADQRRVLGADHPDTLLTRNNLASLRGQTGDLAGAIAELATLLADQQHVLGADHPDIIITRNNLAYWRERLEP